MIIALEDLRGEGVQELRDTRHEYARKNLRFGFAQRLVSLIATLSFCAK